MTVVIITTTASQLRRPVFHGPSVIALGGNPSFCCQALILSTAECISERSIAVHFSDAWEPQTEETSVYRFANPRSNHFHHGEKSTWTSNFGSPPCERYLMTLTVVIK